MRAYETRRGHFPQGVGDMLQGLALTREHGSRLWRHIPNDKKSLAADALWRFESELTKKTAASYVFARLPVSVNRRKSKAAPALWHFESEMADKRLETLKVSHASEWASEAAGRVLATSNLVGEKSANLWGNNATLPYEIADSYSRVAAFLE